MFFNFIKKIISLGCAGVLLAMQTTAPALAQTQTVTLADGPATLARYLDQTGGMTADEAVAFALLNNGELAAARKEIEAARALVKQAGLRPNPSVEFSRQEQIGGSDNDTMIAGSLPLELGGRRKTRVGVAEAELSVREKEVANRERLLAAEVRAKFGEALANTLKLKLVEDLLETALQGFRLVQARVGEGKTAPLEENMTLVEVNRLHSTRETEAGKTEIVFLELRNLLGMKPEEPLRLRGDFRDLLAPLPPLAEAMRAALQTRPDLLAVRAMETLAAAQIEQARAAGRIDASVSAGYGRNNFGFPVNGITEVRAKFGEALANTLKLKLVEDLLETALQGFRLVQARVGEGKTAPLEENMTLVEVNRLHSTRETEAGKTEIVFLELRNLLGMKPEEPLRLRGDFRDLLAPLPPLAEAMRAALQTRPDLLAVRAMETLAAAQIEQARAAGRIDASVSAGYGRNNFGFPVNGITDTGQLRPVQDVFHSFKFGVTFELPVRNRNQGAIEAAAANLSAAGTRREFAELTIRREVAAAFARYQSAARAGEIFRVGVRDQANANLQVVRQTYELGARNLIEYLIEQRRFIELENEFIDAQLAVYAARVEILRATNAPELINK
jgi:outer membrane protein TolC